MNTISELSDRDSVSKGLEELAVFRSKSALEPVDADGIPAWRGRERVGVKGTVDEDVLDAAIIRRVLEDPDQELVPFELVKRIASGEHPVRVWREYRGLKAGELAAVAGLAASYLSDIENGKKPGSVKAMKQIAAALNITVDDLI